MKNIKVSVIMPCYNLENSLEETIQSVLAQTLDSIEIIAVDDGSKDNTWEILQKYPQIKSYQTPNGGYGSAVNFGIDRANGEYIAILEDDVINEDYYYILYQEAKREELEVVFYNSYLEYREHFKPNFIQKYYPNHNNLMTENEICIRLAHGDVGIWLGIYKKSFLTEHQIRLDEKIRVYEDVPFVANILLYVQRIKIVTGCGLFYRKDVQGQSTSNIQKFLLVIDCIDATLQHITNTRENTKRRSAAIGYCFEHLKHSYERFIRYNKPNLAEVFLAKIKEIVEEFPFSIYTESIGNFFKTHGISSSKIVLKNKFLEDYSKLPTLESFFNEAYYNQFLALFCYKIGHSFAKPALEINTHLSNTINTFIRVCGQRKNLLLFIFLSYCLKSQQKHTFFSRLRVDCLRSIYYFLSAYKEIDFKSSFAIEVQYESLLSLLPELSFKEISLEYEANEDLRRAAFIKGKILESQKSFLKYITNKSIAIIGNSPCELGLNKGKEIDSHDIVIRFNNFELSDILSKDYGKKTHVWAISPSFQTIKINPNLYQYDYIISTDAIHFFYETRQNFLLNYFINGGNFFQIEAVSVLHATNILVPSLGLVLLSFLINNKHLYKKISLYGFSLIDHYEGKRHYFDNDPNRIEDMKFHKWTEEALVLNEFKKRLEQ